MVYFFRPVQTFQRLLLTRKLLGSWIQLFSLHFLFSSLLYVYALLPAGVYEVFFARIWHCPFFETFVERWAIVFLIVWETIKTVMTGRLVFVSSEGLSHLVALYDKQWILSTYSNPKSAEYKNIRGFYESDCVVYMKMKTKTIRCWLVNAKADIWFIQRYIYVYIALGFSICVYLRPSFKF